MKKVYVSGPVTGRPDDNRTAFEAAASQLIAAGCIPLVPHDFVEPGSTWEEAMQTCISVLMGADAVMVLPDWEASRGALIEVRLARDLGIPVHEGIPA